MPFPKDMPAWNKGIGKGWVTSQGFRAISITENGRRIQIAEHRLVMERFLGRKLAKWEEVYHKDGNRLNNVLGNLALREWDHQADECVAKVPKQGSLFSEDGHIYMSRVEAKKRGEKFFFTGVPCKLGHVGPRLTAGGRCYECMLATYVERSIRYQKANPEKVAAYEKAYLEINREKISERKRNQRRANTDAIKAYSKKYSAENRDLRTAQQARRKAGQLERMPPWFGELDDFVAKEAYALAALRKETTGIGWHVDHMIPMKSRTASGLHIANNLQVIPAVLNIRKLNRMWLTEPGEWIKEL